MENGLKWVQVMGEGGVSSSCVKWKISKTKELNDNKTKLERIKTLYLRMQHCPKENKPNI